jgi:hypothetical protein
MDEPKKFGENWFIPNKEERAFLGKPMLGDKERKELDWWCRHYKDGVSYLSFRIMEYLQAKDDGDLERMSDIEGLLRACLPYYWEEVVTR